MILIGVLVLTLSLAGLLWYTCRPEGDTVGVKVNGEVYGTYLLSETVTVDICTGKNQNQHNVMVIEDGRVRVQSATCPDGICAGHKPIHRDGESIVCRPHGLVITVHATAESQQPDVIA